MAPDWPELTQSARDRELAGPELTQSNGYQRYLSPLISGINFLEYG